MNIWTGLLFLEGAIADAPLARELAGDGEAAGAEAIRDEPPSLAGDAPAGARLY